MSRTASSSSGSTAQLVAVPPSESTSVRSRPPAAIEVAVRSSTNTPSASRAGVPTSGTAQTTRVGCAAVPSGNQLTNVIACATLTPVVADSRSTTTGYAPATPRPSWSKGTDSDQ